MKTKTMMDCIDLINNQLKPEEVGAAILWTDKNYNNEWINHINDLEKLMNDARYVIDEKYRNEVSTFHFNNLYLFIKRYKHEAFLNDDKILDEFNNLFDNPNKL